MMQSYTIDPARITLRHFFDLTRKRRMLPSRVLLHEKMDERFALLSGSGIKNLADLLKVLKSKEKLEDFALQSGLDSSYLTLLKREAGSYLARPHPLSDFPGVPFEYTELLKSRGIGTTRTFFDRAQTDAQRTELAGRTGIPETRLRELYVLCDLSRITGVGGTMARMAYEAGIRSTAAFAVTEERFEGQLSEDDMTYCREYAKLIAKMDLKDTR
jgi:hypothetical protein